MTLTKLEPTDIEGYDWEWFAKYGDDVIDELTKAFEIAMLSAEPTLAPAEAGRLAAQWAETRGAELITNVVDTTRVRVRELVSQSIQDGDSLQALQKTLREDFSFSPVRAERIARTESAEALGQGSKQAAVSQGRDEKRWVDQGDTLVNIPICRTNALQGWIKIGDPFQSGHDQIPGHVNCRCNVRYRTNFDEEGEERMVAEVHCPKTGHRLPLNNLRGSADVYCKHCNEEHEV